MPKKKIEYDYGTGRRKSSVARVFIKKGSGKVTINDRALDDYFPGATDWRYQVTAPLAVLEQLDKFDVKATVKGGGMTGQAGALKLGLARALDKHELRLLGLTMADVRAAHLNRSAIKSDEESDTEGGESGGLPDRPWHVTLRGAGYLTRDPRVVERKVVGLVKARKAKQFSKR